MEKEIRNFMASVGKDMSKVFENMITGQNLFKTDGIEHGSVDSTNHNFAAQNRNFSAISAQFSKQQTQQVG